MTDRLSGIAAFVTAADAGSFALAAERMNLSRSAVGKSIARLEERLGVRLFQRTTRSLSLTDDGQGFYERCVRALAELDSAEAELDAGQHAPSGRLRVSAPVLFGRHCVAPILLELVQRHPQLELELFFNDRPLDLVEERIDLAIRSGPLGNSAGLAARRLGAQAMQVCAAPAYLATHGRPQHMADLARHTGIVYHRSGMPAPWRFLDPSGQIQEAPIAHRIRFDDLESIANAACAGIGLAWLPSWLVTERLRSGELVRVLEQEIPFSFAIHALWPQTRHMPSRLRAAIDLLVERIPAMLELTA